MNVQEIKEAVRQGKSVKWASDIYDVELHYTSNNEEQWLITCKPNNHSWGLTWADDTTLNGREDQFYIAETVLTHDNIEVDGKYHSVVERAL